MVEPAVLEADPERPLSLRPLLCGACGGPVPLGDADRAVCPYCAAPVEIPRELRAVRAANRRSVEDHARVEAAFRRLGSPPGRLLHAWAGLAEGALHTLWIASTAFLKLWLKLLAFLFRCLTDIDDLRVWLVVLALPLIPVAGLLVVLGTGLHALGPRFGADPIAVLGPAASYALIGAALCLLLAIPLAVFHFADAFAQVRHRLQASMAARPPFRAGGPALCRRCGAALSVPSGALGVRCDYCQSDNLVALPPAWVAAAKQTEAGQHREILEAVREEQLTRDAARTRLLQGLLVSALLVPIFAGLGIAACGTGLVPGQIGWSWDSVISDTHEIVPAVWPVWKDGSASQPPLMHVLSGLPFAKGICANGHCELDYDVPLRGGEALVLQTDAAAPDGLVRFAVAPSSPWRRGGHLASRSFTAPYTGWFRLRLLGAKSDRVQVGWRVTPSAQ